jgi:hypothetical protein
MKISKKMLPKGIKSYIKSQKKLGGKIKLHSEHILKATIIDGIIAECRYFEDNTSLEWYENYDILYIFVDGKCEHIFENGKLI